MKKDPVVNIQLKPKYYYKEIYTLKKYVVGIIFDTQSEYVLLIRKNRPTWQAGKLNGIGGHIEEDELPYEAIVRECKEECGLVLYNWLLVDVYTDNNTFTVYYFTIKTPSIDKATSITDEQIEIWSLHLLKEEYIIHPTYDIINLTKRF